MNPALQWLADWELLGPAPRLIESARGDDHPEIGFTVDGWDDPRGALVDEILRDRGLYCAVRTVLRCRAMGAVG